MRGKYSNTVAAVFGLLIGGGCSHYYLPSSRLESPEALGKSKWGRLEVGGQQGPDLVAQPTLSYPSAEPSQPPPSPVPQLQTAMAMPLVGAWISLDENLDLGFRLQPEAPLQVKVKYQIAGNSESFAHSGNFSVSLAGGGGILLGGGATFYSGSASIIGGYRLWEHHLFMLTPFVDFAGLSGVPLPSPTATSASATQYGASLGYQYDLEAIYLRLEETLARGSFNTNEIHGYYSGLLLGIRF